MRIEHIALLSAVVFGAVSCAKGTGDLADLAAGGSSTGGEGGSATDGGGTVGIRESTPALAPAPVSTEVTGSYTLDVTC
ncbi:MAG TPA: hypothetical protein VIF09_29825, partial [Polyangiaceae bacterium]